MSHYSEIRAQSPVLCLEFNETSGNVAVDSSSNAIACTYGTYDASTGGYDYQPMLGLPGAKAGGYAIRTKQGWVDCGNPTALQITGSVTLFSVFRIDAWPTNITTIDQTYAAGIAGKGYDGTNEGYQLRTNFNTPQELDWLTYSPGAGNVGVQAYVATSLTVGAWHRVAGIYNSATSTWSLWVDGTIVATATGAAPNVSNAHFFVGAEANNSQHRFGQFSFDHVAVFNSALSTTILNSFATQVTGAAAPAISSITVNSTGTAVTVVFSEAVSGVYAPDYIINGVTQPIAVKSVSGSGTTWTLVPKSIIPTGTTTLTYQGITTIDANNNSLPQILNHAVTNNSTVPVLRCWYNAATNQVASDQKWSEVFFRA